MKKSLCIAASLAVIAAGLAEAATINVNSTADVIANDGACTLREAVIAANEDSPSGVASGECRAGSGTDLIRVPAGTYTLQIPGRQESLAREGDLDLRSNLTIQGAGATSTVIDGNRLDRVFHGFITSSTVSLIGLRIRNGYSDDQGGGIYTRSKTLQLIDCVVVGNESDLEGGGIFVGCPLNIPPDQTCGPLLSLLSTEVRGNSSALGGGGIYLRDHSASPATETANLVNSEVDGNSSDDEAGGIYSSGSLYLSNSTVVDNSAASTGGGIFNDSPGVARIENSTLSGNAALIVGGGIDNRPGADLEVVSSTLSGNLASVDGGGIFNRPGGDLGLFNSTVSGNSAVRDGGGLFNNGTAVSRNATFSANSAGSSATASYNAGTLTFFNTIISGNCAGVSPVSSGGNLESPGNTCNFVLGSDQNSVTSGNLKLSSLGDFGGWTRTHRPLSGSAAIDKGVNGTCRPTDQRGVDRPVDGDLDTIAQCDVGSVEAVPCPDEPLVTISNRTITGTESHGACVELRLGPGLFINSPADVTVNAGTRIVFENGVQIGQNAQLKAIID